MAKRKPRKRAAKKPEPAQPKEAWGDSDEEAPAQAAAWRSPPPRAREAADPQGGFSDSEQGDFTESDDEGEVHVDAAIAEPEHPEEMMPAMHVCADELASGDLDELQAIRKVRVELEQLQEAIRQDELAPVSAGVPKKRIHALQRATQAMIDRSVAQKIEAAARSVEEAEKGSVVKNVSEFIEAYAQGTGSKPLSMYGPEMWAMCFPHLFPYGDGVFGLPRSEPLTFQQCSVMHLLREELVYQVDKKAVSDADNAFGPGIALGDSDARPASHSSCKCKHCQDSCCLRSEERV